MALSFVVIVAIRYLLLLFLPFSALDTILNFKRAVAQARERIPSDELVKLAIAAALCIEVIAMKTWPIQ